MVGLKDIAFHKKIIFYTVPVLSFESVAGAIWLTSQGVTYPSSLLHDPTTQPIIQNVGYGASYMCAQVWAIPLHV